MPNTFAPTLVAALDALRDDAARGYVFQSSDGRETLVSFRQLGEEARRRAGRLQALGLRKGDRLGIIVEDGREFVLSFLGAITAGIVPVPMYPTMSFKDVAGYLATVRHILATAGARALLVSPTMRPHVQDAANTAGVERWLGFEDLEGEATFAPVDVRPEDVAFLQFTSGSTSRPKGVVVTHANLQANAHGIMVDGLKTTPADKGVSWLPLYHDMGLIGFVIAPLFANVQVVFLQTATFARRPWAWLDAISRHRGTITFAPNFAYALVAKRLRDKDLAGLDLSSLRIAGCGAEPIQARTLLAFADRMAPTGFRLEAFAPSYGMAEATLAISFACSPREPRWQRLDAQALRQGKVVPARADDAEAVEIVNCGRVIAGHSVRIVSPESGAVLGEDEIGEVTFAGPSVTRGYFEAPEATAAAYRDGWLHTGDLGYVSGGDVFICGRSKDLVIVRGRNYFPQDIEWVAAEVEGVRRGNVVAFPTFAEGEEQLVVVAEALSSEAEGLPERIAAAVLRAVGVTPWRVELVSQGTLPRTSSGKPQRRKTRELFETGGLQLIRASGPKAAGSDGTSD